MKAYILGAQLMALPADTEVVIDGGVGVGELPVHWSSIRDDGKFGICVAVPDAPSPIHWCAGTRHGWPVLACGEDPREGAGLHTHDRASVNCPACCVKLDATGWTPTAPAPKLQTPVSIPRGESKTVRLVVNGGPAVEYVHPAEHERVKAAAKKALSSRDHLNTVQLQWERWARDLSGLSKASPAAVRARLSSLIDSLAEYRELAMDLGDVKDPATPDAELRAALVAETEAMARDAAKAMRLERERDKARGLHKAAVRLGGEVAGSFKAASDRLDRLERGADIIVTENKRLKGLLDTCEELLDAWRKRAIGLLGYGTFARWGGDDAGLWRRLLQKFAGDSTTPVRALLALAMGIEPGQSLVAALDRFERLAAEARQAIEHGDRVHAAGVVDGAGTWRSWAERLVHHFPDDSDDDLRERIEAEHSAERARVEDIVRSNEAWRQKGIAEGIALRDGERLGGAVDP